MAHTGGWLKTKQRTIRDSFPENLGLRVHRAISWILKAETEQDPDGQFIFLWIALNACYAEYGTDINARPERNKLGAFFEKIVGLDSENLIYKAIWEQYSQPIRLILSNKHVFEPFWSHHNAIKGYENWEASFEKAKTSALLALKEKNPAQVLNIVFDRLYVLRNQLVHGGSTHNGQVNRSQVSDGSKILGHLMPIFVNVMMDHPSTPWGEPFYPVTNA